MKSPEPKVIATGVGFGVAVGLGVGAGVSIGSGADVAVGEAAADADSDRVGFGVSAAGEYVTRIVFVVESSLPIRNFRTFSPSSRSTVKTQRPEESALVRWSGAIEMS
jgi:hypothetical protein